MGKVSFLEKLVEKHIPQPWITQRWKLENFDYISDADTIGLAYVLTMV